MSLLMPCSFYYPCDDNVSTVWYKNASDEMTANGERISILGSDKYGVIQQSLGGTTNNSNFVRCCFATSFLIIRRFNHSDIGYYQCQIIANNSLLQPSPFGHISPSVERSADGEQNCLVGDLIHKLNPPICAENASHSVSSTVSCTNSQSTTVTTRAYSEITDFSSMMASQNEDATTTSKNSEVTNTNPWVYGTTLRDTEIAEENMWLYGTIVGAVVSITLVVIVFVMSTSIVCWKCRTKQHGKPLHVFR